MVSNSWQEGPIKDVELSPPHGRGILCMDILGNMVCTGSSDHGLRGIWQPSQTIVFKDVWTHRMDKDGRILSGGMDSKLCLWDAKAVKCQDLKVHNASISKVMVDKTNTAIVASYDTTLSIWNLNYSKCENLLAGKHTKPVTEFDWKNSLCVSGDRDGTICVWDINKAKCIYSYKAHSGQVSKIVLYSDGANSNLILSGGASDGSLCVVDMRTLGEVFKKQVHGGSISMLEVNLSNLIITGSADKSVKVFDISGGFEPLGSIPAKAIVCCGTVHENTAVAGYGDGNLLFYNLDEMKIAYGFGAISEGPVNCVKLNEAQNRLVAGGENGHGIVLGF